MPIRIRATVLLTMATLAAGSISAWSGRIDEATAGNITELLMAISQQDAQQVNVDHYDRWGGRPGWTTPG